MGLPTAGLASIAFVGKVCLSTSEWKGSGLVTANLSHPQHCAAKCDQLVALPQPSRPTSISGLDTMLRNSLMQLHILGTNAEALLADSCDTCDTSDKC